MVTRLGGEWIRTGCPPEARCATCHACGALVHSRFLVDYSVIPIKRPEPAVPLRSIT
jgi:hypothetical protein